MNKSLSERAVLASLDLFRGGGVVLDEARWTGRFFASRFLASQKMRQGERPPWTRAAPARCTAIRQHRRDAGSGSGMTRRARRREASTPSVGAGFLLDQKTGQTSEATHEIKKVKAGETFA